MAIGGSQSEYTAYSNKNGRGSTSAAPSALPYEGVPLSTVLGSTQSLTTKGQQQKKQQQSVASPQDAVPAPIVSGDNTPKFTSEQKKLHTLHAIIIYLKVSLMPLNLHLESS